MPIQVYAFGSNGSGQLGIGHEEDTSTPTRCIFDEDHQEGQQLEQQSVGGEAVIVAGGNHTIVLFKQHCHGSSGKVYAAGYNGDGRCGVSQSSSSPTATATTDDKLLHFRRVEIPPSLGGGGGGGGGGGRRDNMIKLVSATWEASFLVSSSDTVYAMGTGLKGELGLGTLKTSACVPVPVVMPCSSGSTPSIKAISSGMGHTVVVLTNGFVYGWGASRKGQLGPRLKGEKIVWSPERLVDVGISNVSDVACGREFTVLCGDKGKGEFVILGSEDDNRWGVFDAPSQLSIKRTLISSPSTVLYLRFHHNMGGYSSISTSWNGIYVCLDDGKVVAWGRNDRGQLLPSSYSDAPKWKRIAVGSEHGMGVLADGKTVVAFGWGEHGNCGSEVDDRGDVKEKCHIVMKEKDEVVGIAAGCATSWIVVVES